MNLFRRSTAGRYDLEPQSCRHKIISLGSPPFPCPKMQIREYRENDRNEVRRICCETGFFGNPIDAIYRDRELFADLITGPYLDYAPEWSLVAESDGRVVGYLLGTVNTHFKLNLMYCGMNVVIKMLFRLITGKYSDHPRSKRYIRWVLAKGLKEQPKHPENAAHLHLNLKRIYRGRTIAKQMWLIYEEMLKAAGVGQYYAEFYSYSRHRPERVYARYGFKFFDRCETTMFRPEIRIPVYVVCLNKSLPIEGIE